MQFTINIDEKMFDESGIGEIIKETFINMTDEEKSSVMKEILKQYLLDSSFVKNYFIEKKYDHWLNRNIDSPTENFRNLIKNIDFSNDMEKVKKVFIEVIEKDLYKELLELMVNSYVKAISDNLFRDSSFRCNLQDNIQGLFSQRINELK